ncbi:NADH dehydrogenase [Hephaestia caeni]|uniref:NADH dehydrogenase n=1 Tax=Hephaestia caeni TaxID=645617 RepID=A0A397P4W3_9SPHN|nr:complex I NDUFA9 subunit family protein [Hephaestia caeni]RIA44580.1 NADH dehydrogenase [Hephaestia caeni]
MNDRLVTLIGGGGFVGRYAAQALLKAGARVRIAQRDPRQAWFLKPLGGLGQTQFVAADVRRPDSIARAVTGADAVINLVGVLNGDFQALHVEGARHVAEACAAAGVEALVQLSAIGADRESPAAYGRSKAAGEAAVRAAFPAATIARPSIVFGREDRFVNRFAEMIAAASAMPLARIVPVVRADTRFQPVYVGDVARALVTALAAPEAFGGKTIELGGPDVLSMRALLQWIAGAIGRDPTFVDLPDPVARIVAALPGTPITRDQLLMLARDNVVTGANGLDAVGVVPTPLAAVAPAWLVQYRRSGRFGTKAVA